MAATNSPFDIFSGNANSPFSGGFTGLPRAHPGDQTSLGDTANWSSNILNQLLQTFGPITDWAGRVGQDIASGGGQFVNQLIAPGVAGLKAQVPQTIRQIQDTVGSAGIRDQSMANTYEDLQKNISNMYSSTQNALGLHELGVGESMPFQIISNLLGIGSLRNAANQTKNAGGGGKGGGLLGSL